MAKGRGKGGCIDNCLACLLITFNTVLLLIGLGLTVLGGLCYFRPRLVLGAIDTYEFVSKWIKGNENPLEADEIAGYLLPFGLAIFIVGIVVSIVSFVGCCGARCKIRLFLIIYAVVIALVALFLAAIIIAFFGFRGKIADDLQERFLGFVHEKYRGDDDVGSTKSVYSLIITAINREFDCCGVINYKDFDGSTQWNRSATYKDASDNNQVANNLVTPLSCCIHEGQFPNDKPKSPPTCATQPTNSTSNWYQGCWDAVVDRFDEPTRLSVFGLCAFFVVLILLFAFSIYLCRSKEFMGE